MGTTSDRQKVTDDQLLMKIKGSTDPFVTAEELSEQLPITRQAVNKRLRDLMAEGFIDRKQCGSGYGWWISKRPN